MTDHIKEVIKATLITEENYVIIYNLVKMTNDVAISAVKIGNWFISQTIRVDSLFKDLPFGNVEQRFAIVRGEDLAGNLRLIGEPSGELKSHDAERW